MHSVRSGQFHISITPTRKSLFIDHRKQRKQRKAMSSLKSQLAHKKLQKDT
jgi:hypothetical protein